MENEVYWMGRRKLLTFKDKIAIKKRLENSKYILEPEGCWLWTECCGPSGHGQLTIDRKTYRVHQLAMYVYKNLDISQFITCHKIFCKRKNCFNPDHLYAGTSKSNAQDIVKAGDNLNSKKTHCLKGHSYQGDNLVINNLDKRICYTCSRASLIKSRLNKKILQKGKRGELK